MHPEDGTNVPDPQYIVTQQYVNPNPIQNQIPVVAQQQVDPRVLQGQPMMVPQQQQVIYIDLNYRPDVNYRNWSYLAIGFGLLVYFGTLGSIGYGAEGSAYAISNSICCFSFAIAFLMDAAYYKGKSDWQTSTGQSNGGSMTGMIFDIIFAIIAIIYSAVMIIFGFGDPML